MRKFLNKVILFLLLIGTVATVLQVAISMHIKNKTIATHDTWHLKTNQQNEAIFLGSSRCFAHFSPVLFSEKMNVQAANLGVDGHSELTMHIVRLKYYLQRNKSPKVVILNFDPFISAGAYTGNYIYNKDCFARYVFWPSKADEQIADYFGFTFLEKYIPLYALLRYKKIMQSVFSATEQYALYDQHDERWDTTKYPLNSTEATGHYNILQQYDDIKEKLITLKGICDKQKIHFICVQSPVYKAIYRQAEYQATERLCKELNIPFFDTNIETITTDPHNFYNSNHMNSNGVNKMTEYLAGNPSFTAFLK